MKEYPQMKPLLVFMKYFLLQRGLHETYGGGMGSYLACNVVLHFLQRHPSRRDQRQYSATSLGHLLYDFLKYYGQEFRYDDHGVSVLNGGATFNKSDFAKGGGKGKGKKGKGGVTLCLKSPSDETIDLGGACFRMGVIKNLFHHGFHCLCHLMVSRSPPEVSMLCPLLLDPAHPVITDRHQLMSEQPVALPGLPRAADRADEEDLAADSLAPSPSGSPPAKRARLASPLREGSGEGDEIADAEEFDGEVENWTED